MLQLLLTTLAGALSARFSCPVYADDLPQGFSAPCIFLHPLPPTLTPQPNGLVCYKLPFDVELFGETYTELFRAAEPLLDTLRLLTLPDGSRLRGTGARYEVAERALHGFVTYRVTLRDAPTDEPTMEGLTARVFPSKK